MTATGIAREEEIPPRASVLIESLRDIGYSLQTAVADVIDNSLAAGAGKIELLAETHADAPSIGILDDGAGMTRSELLEAMRPGKQESYRGSIGNRPRPLRTRTQDRILFPMPTTHGGYLQEWRGVCRYLGPGHRCFAR